MSGGKDLRSVREELLAARAEAERRTKPQAPSPKLQRNFKHQTPKRPLGLGFLEFEGCDFTRVWGLEFFCSLLLFRHCDLGLLFLWRHDAEDAPIGDAVRDHFGVLFDINGAKQIFVRACRALG